MERGRKFITQLAAAAALFLMPQLVSADAATVVADKLGDAKARYQRPVSIPFPAENAYSDAKATLGQMLFFDPRLSFAGTMSCATCHNPALAWQDGLRVGIGHDAKALPRSTPTVIDLAWAELLMWDGRKEGLEDQASGPISTAAEMGGSLEQVVAIVSDLPGYRSAFSAAFGAQEVTFPRIAQAIATFERTLVSNKAPFDHWIDGDEAAIGDEAKRGFVLFNGKGNCAACHSTWRLTDDAFHDIGLPSLDPGRASQVPDEPSLEHAFKTPTLRNVDRRGPYMHDGSIATLRDVIVHYDTGFLPRPSVSQDMQRLHLSNGEVNDLLAFLQTLTSVDDPIIAPNLPVKDMVP